jgi:hypothetical protein
MGHRLPWQRLLAEGAIILASVLTAFWVEAWRAGREARGLEAEMFAAVGLEFRGNFGAGRFSIGVTERQLTLVDRFLRSRPTALADIPSDSVPGWISALAEFPIVRRNTHAADMLLTVPPTSARAMAGRRQVGASFRAYGNVADLEAEIEEVRRRLRTALLPHAGGASGDGLGSVATMISRQGPSGLSALRSDPEVVAAVFAKGALQSEYRDALAAYVHFLKAYIPETCPDIAAAFPDTSSVRDRNFRGVAETMCQFY